MYIIDPLLVKIKPYTYYVRNIKGISHAKNPPQKIPNLNLPKKPPKIISEEHVDITV
jgi:hypothetical protein